MGFVQVIHDGLVRLELEWNGLGDGRKCWVSFDIHLESSVGHDRWRTAQWPTHFRLDQPSLTLK